MSKNMRVTARVTLTVVVEAGTWGDGCPCEQVFKDGAQSAVANLERIFDASRNGELIAGGVKQHIRASIVSRPRVEAVMAEEG